MLFVLVGVQRSVSDWLGGRFLSSGWYILVTT